MAWKLLHLPEGAGKCSGSKLDTNLHLLSSLIPLVTSPRPVRSSSSGELVYFHHGFPISIDTLAARPPASHRSLASSARLKISINVKAPFLDFSHFSARSNLAFSSVLALHCRCRFLNRGLLCILSEAGDLNTVGRHTINAVLT